MSPSWHFAPEYDELSKLALETALNSCTAYRSWRDYDPGPIFPVSTRYASLPSLTKKDIRVHFPDGFVPAGRDLKDGLEKEEVWFVTTSGTMDLAVTNIWNPEWWFASERASWELNAHLKKIATPGHTEAILANPINVGFKSDEGDLPRERRRWGNYLYLNEKTTPLLWTPRLMERMVMEMASFQPDILEANPSLLARLCRYITATGRPVYQPGAIVLTYEYPTVFHYRQIRSVFGSPLVSSYGSTEIGYVFEECENGRLHQNTTYCRVDFQPLAPEQLNPDVGRILVTPFHNEWYKLLRFDVGDLVRLDRSGPCPCGRNDGIILAAIEGRSLNSTLTTQGRLITAGELDRALSHLSGIDEYRFDQEAPDDYVLRLVSGRSDRETITQEATLILNELYGSGARITILYEAAITPETSGKYRLSRASFPIVIEDFLDSRFFIQNKEV